MNNKKTLCVLRLLRVFTMTGELEPSEAEEMAEKYRHGDKTGIEEFVNRTNLSYQFEDVINQMKCLIADN